MEKLTNINTIKNLLIVHSRTDGAKKQFGQNFLVSEHVLETIVNTADLQPTDIVIEIGPGLGVLTRELVLRAGKVIAVEKDRDMLKVLDTTIIKDTPHSQEKITLVNQDALQFTPTSAIPSTKSYKLVANLPYNVATVILQNFLIKTTHRPTSITVLIQKEVAEKMCATPGDHNVLSLTIQAYGTPKIIDDVSPGSFFPPPKVTSCIISIIPLSTPLIPDNLAKLYFQLIHAAFSQKRKMLGKSLQAIIKDKPKLLEILARANIDPQIRPQELTIQDWVKLAENCA